MVPLGSLKEVHLKYVDILSVCRGEELRFKGEGNAHSGAFLTQIIVRIIIARMPCCIAYLDPGIPDFSSSILLIIKLIVKLK